MCQLLIDLVDPNENRSVSIVTLIGKYTLINSNLGLLVKLYHTQSEIPIGVFRDFVSTLEDKEIMITEDNFADRSQSNMDFGYKDITTQLKVFQSSAEHLNAEVR
jgi:hypothetical protein